MDSLTIDKESIRSSEKDPFSSRTTSISQNDKAVESVQVTEDDQLNNAKIPRVDGGRGAWMYLAATFVLEALVWGFPFSFGVFQEYYSTHAPFAEQNSTAVVGTCTLGLMYLWAPVSLYILDGWPQIRRYCSLFGLVIVTGALIASSFATKVWQLILTQGVLYAIGGSFLYSPTVFYLDEWFIKKKGLAFGIMWAGVGCAGLVFPFLLNFLLERYEHATTIRIWSAVVVVLCGPLIFWIQPRIPLPTPLPPRKKASYTFFTSQSHLFLQVGNLLESLGFFLPAIYLPLYASSFTPKLPSYTSNLLLALLNASSVLGAIGLGALCDKLHVTTVIGISTAGSVIGILVWGLSDGMATLVVFAVCYGVFAGGYSAIWTGMIKEVQKDPRGKHAGIELMGIFAAGRGIGSISSGPISDALLRAGKYLNMRGRMGFQSDYMVMIVFTGVSAFLGGVVAYGAKGVKHTVCDDDEEMAERIVGAGN